MTLPNDFDFPFTGLDLINAAGAGWDASIDANNQLLRDIMLGGESMLAFRRDLDLDLTNSLFVVPTGWFYVPTRILVINTTGSAYANSNWNFGDNSPSYNNWKNGGSNFTLGANSVHVISPTDLDDLTIYLPAADFRSIETGSAGYPATGIHMAVLGYGLPDDGSI